MIRAVICALALCSLTACGQAPTPSRVARDSEAITARVSAGHLRRHISQFPRTLDPALNEDVAAYTISDDLFEGLVRLDADGSVVPAVAERWETSTDGLVWRFFLRRDARWSNGDPVTAADFVFAWRRVVNPATASPAAQQFVAISGAQEILTQGASFENLAVTAPNPYEVHVQLSTPTPYFLYLLSNCWFMPVHEASVRRHGKQWTEAGKLVGNGAFVLKSVTVNGPIELQRSPTYRDASAVRLQAVTFYPINDTAAATARFLAGDLDITDRFQIGDIAWLRPQLGEQVRLEPYLGTFMMAMDVTRPPFSDLRLRRAMVMALDREILTGKVFKGYFTPAYQLVPPLPGYTPARPEWAELSDAARHREAQRLYHEAGYSSAKPLDVQLWYPTADADTRRVLEAMSAMWRVNLGANVRLANEEWRVHQQNRHIRKHRLFFYPWIGDYPDALTFLALPLASSGQNYMGYNNAAYAQAVDAAARTVDDTGRNAAYRRAETILNDDAVIIPLYFYRSRHLLGSYVQGWRNNPMDRHPSRDLYLAVLGGS
jgi:oligopeptide transport system substrate-binding protein